MQIRTANASDIAVLAAMRASLWPDQPPGALARELDGLLRARDANERAFEAFLALENDGVPLGFAEASIRSFAEGCATDRVGYLEAWFVGAEARGRGVGRALVGACERWARARGCTEFASDAERDDEASAEAHLALGFDEVGVVRCFRKAL